ncbi:MAG: hypothetical protein ACREPW_05990 [Candidatus Binataceae bacterium]
MLKSLSKQTLVSDRFDPSCASDSIGSKYAMRSLFIQTDCPLRLSLTNAIYRSRPSFLKLTTSREWLFSLKDWPRTINTCDFRAPRTRPLAAADRAGKV